MENQEEIFRIDIDERMKDFGASGMLLSLNLPDIEERDIRNFYILGGMVICLCRRYEGSIYIDGKEHKLGESSIAILPEKHLVRFTESIKVETIQFIAVTTDYILNMPSPIDTSIFSYSRYIPVMQVSDSKFDDFQSYFRFLYKESNEKSTYQDEILRSILYALILEITGEYDAQYNLNTGAEIKSHDVSDKFFHLLAVYYKENRTVQFYADKLNITSKYLTTAIKKTTGRPVLEWLHEAVLIEAKMLLMTTDLTVQEISDRLNFSSPSAFVQFFKKHTGTTPKKI
ncbi:MAG: AraC family transcriptional regulator [Bacteroidales bacterium]|nr:AraC family transcriptional regulator [Bacteroidales bacterium]